MDKIRFVKWGGWLALIGMLLGLFTVISAQPEFLSINCGGKTNHTAENNITWVTDADYIDVGQSGDIGDASKEAFGSALHSLRFFPKPLNKSCYHLSVTPNVTHLLRLWFAVGNFNGYQNFPINFAFSIETVDMLFLQNVTAKTVDPFYHEYILFTAGRVEYICLVRTSETDDPFISGIELRRLQDDMYVYDSAPAYILVLESRVDTGGNSSVRYPMDKFDRIWATSSDLPSDLNVRNVSSRKPLSTNNTQNLPPTDVLQTAWVVKGLNSFPLSWSWSRSRWTETENSVTRIVVLYFAEIETVNKSESRSFYVLLDGCQKTNPLVTLVPNYSVLEYTLFCDYAPSNYELVKAPDFPIINAYEYYTQVFTDTTTYQQDIDALDAMKWRFDMKDWISDPCYLIPWNGIGCDNSSGLIRISEIDLSGRNLTGSAPKDIAQLTELVSVSLNDNHFTGPMPNFTNLTMLERLYLQNNNLTGTVEWLSELKSLKELCLQNNKLSGPVEWLSELKSLTKLNIENNNFSGVIPRQLLLNCSLKLNYSGNPYLRMNKRKCFLHNLTLSGIKNSQPNNSQRNKLKVVLGITLSGILTIALASIASMVLYRKKFWKKEECVVIRRRGVEKETKPDYSMIMVPNPTKSRAFTLDEMIAATQNFSREIGRGGFGELPEGKVIAVKVLSLFSRQGIHEFLNEVDLLSKINHKNLVSLLGYCNKTREVMLIYEHMSGGSLTDHLYGPRAENSDVDWKKRLKIALDAAQGLEYLHLGCIPKIIHRDIKTANILLDSNLNGKLGDFGLSRMTIDGEATHVITAVKGTFGYLDPEYYNTQMLTEKSDVYSFGVVLLEIISGRPPIDIKRPEEEVNIVRWVTTYLGMDENGGQITEIIDKRLCGGYHMKSMTNVAKIAMRCVKAIPSSRPTASEVVTELKEAIQHEDKDSISIAEEIGIQNGSSLAGQADSSKREGMEWSDNSSNVSKVGR